jgi:hypothetical protein
MNADKEKPRQLQEEKRLERMVLHPAFFQCKPLSASQAADHRPAVASLSQNKKQIPRLRLGMTSYFVSPPLSFRSVVPNLYFDTLT